MHNAENGTENGAGRDVMDELQQLIGEDLQKYHEEKIKRDQGGSPKPMPGPGRGLRPLLRRQKLPQALVRQYFELN